MRSELIAAVIMVCQPAWQLAMTMGLLSASGWRRATSSIKAASARQTSSIDWPGIGSGEKPTK